MKKSSSLDKDKRTTDALFPPLAKALEFRFEEMLESESDIIHRLPTVPSVLYLNPTLLELVRAEAAKCRRDSQKGGGFLPALLQLANVACLPGIVGASVGLPDLHSGYGFAIGHVAAFDVDDPASIVSPGGVGFDINCGVRLIRTNLLLEQVRPVQDSLAQCMYDSLPVGVGKGSDIKLTARDIDEILRNGARWAVSRGLAWQEDLDTSEENGCMPLADPDCVSQRAKGRGQSQLGSLGAGNHYAEIQYVSEVYDWEAARAMGIHTLSQICVMVHCGSRGLGHEVASNYIELMSGTERAELPDPQLACAPISSQVGQEYLKAMAAAANFAYCNRSVLTSFIRNAFEKTFQRTSRDLDMHVVYDVSHNMAKMEDHVVNGIQKRLLVHRKGATRAFPPGHPLLPHAYSRIGQPVLVGGSMGTCSYVLTGGPLSMERSFGSTCHGAGRAKSRVSSKNTLSSAEVLEQLRSQGITVCVSAPQNIAEESIAVFHYADFLFYNQAPSAYKDVIQVVDTCEQAGLSRKAFQLRPIAVVKG